MQPIRWKTRLLAALLLCLTPLGGAPLDAAQRGLSVGRVLVIRDDPGGVVQARVSEIAAIRARGQRVELRGRYCNSACTLYLGLPGACVSPQTRFGFHGPSLYGRPLKAKEFDRLSRVMAAHYPEQLRGWFLTEARYHLTGFITLRGEQLIGMGVARC